MGSFKSKLDRLGGAGDSAPRPSARRQIEPEADDRIAQLRGLIDDVVRRDRNRTRHRRAAASPSGPLPVGALQQTEHGPLHVVERFLEPHHCHGRVPVGSALGQSAEVVSRLALDPTLADVDLSRMLILDTETTGLAGGSGTVPFLIGLAWFEEGALRVEQLFLRNFGEEAPMLQRLAERLAAASCVVSYNGKSFDWPLLRARFILNRVPVNEPSAHLDLLHCARRVLKARLETVRLTHVERELLGFHREGDVDGSLIPGLYTNYLRGTDPVTLLPVIEHNDNDVVALAAVLGRLCEHYAEIELSDDPRDHLSYARVAHRAEDHERAERFARAAVEGGGDTDVALGALNLTAQIARKRGDHRGAAGALHEALDHARSEVDAADVHFALAKLYEHRLGDLARAYRHACQTELAEGEQSQGRRLGRLRRRLDAAR